ncbi:diacylglycerol kinase family lipid kinase [Olleya sp. YS]|uniref:diacylglycerol/lipid kinase family protein n=1 Tax=Olleya sp. YS TaxID=3028318 RepID=UPI0024341351|nr:diacylglycerol kinase family lipid kinase [Olleya sp. YS]WGD35790.1 diacylglycerol kinase family lipid kinase [Olleya sp. YS]
MTAKTSFFVIINPVSGNGKGKTIWQYIKPKLNQRYTIQFAYSEYSKHEIEITKAAIKNGFKHFIIIGGDGTLNNFINGVFGQKDIASSAITFGVIPVGTGNDWVKTYNIPKNINKALQIIINGHTNTQDVGCISYSNNLLPNSYFINLAGVGYDGLVVNLVKDNRSYGKFTYVLGAIKGLSNVKLFDVTITKNKDVLQYTNCFMIQIGLCKYTGSSMRLTKQPDPKDGLFDITVAVNLTKWDVIRNLLKLFNGQIVNHKKVKTFKTKRLILNFEDPKPFIQADGEQLATDNIEVTILPNTIRFYC